MNNDATEFVDSILQNKDDKRIVVVSEDKIAKIKAFIPELMEKKLTEKHYKADHDSLHKRMLTGFVGEAAVEQLLNREITDFTIGKSRTYDKADIFPLNVGIKTVERGLHPLVRVNPKTGEIICIKVSENTVVVCGYASLEVVKKYQDIELVKDYSCRKRGTKSAFTGFNYLKSFTSLDELKQILKEEIQEY
jgi:hypothetical protein